MLQLLPLCHTPAWLGNSPEQEQHSFGAVCQTEKPNHALSSGGPLLPPVLPSTALPNSQKPDPHCCRSAVNLQRLLHSQGLHGATKSGVEPGEMLLIPQELQRDRLSRREGGMAIALPERGMKQALAEHQEGDRRRGAVSSIHQPSAEDSASNEPPPDGNNGG